MLLILAPSASSWSEKPKSTLELMFELPHRAELMFPCSIQMARDRQNPDLSLVPSVWMCSAGDHARDPQPDD